MANVVVAGVIVAGARGIQLYADGLAGDPPILLINFGADYDVDGLLTIRFAETGVATWTMVPEG